MPRTIPAHKVRDMLNSIDALNALTDENQRALRAAIAEIHLEMQTWVISPLTVMGEAA